MDVIAHGGAGGAPDEPETRQEVLDEAVASGVEADSPVDAVIETVKALESSPRFNAGVGGAVQADGVVRTDAGIMTEDRSVGAVCSMPGVEHACEVARVVLEETPHVMVAGVHAVDLADEYGVPVTQDLWSDASRERWANVERGHPDPTSKRAQLDWLVDEFGGIDADGGIDTDGETDTDGGTDATGETDTDGGTDTDGETDAIGDHDTVGAVATDGERCAACTSTAGRWAALAGRVGDVPQVGSGFFCTYAGGASATGAGEDITRVTLSRRAVDHLEVGRDPADAAELAIEEFEDITGSDAGVIVVDQDGDTGSACNTDAMQVAVAHRNSG